MLYRFVAWLLVPLARWGRMQVGGIELVPASGPLLVVPNHDSQMDPVLLGIALRKRRLLRFLGRAELWRNRPLGWLLHAMRQIPIERGAGDAAALDEAVATLEAGDAICIFPEGKLSRGESLRARTGVARLAAACPQSQVVLCTIEGATGYARFPRRPRVRIDFFAPATLPSPAAQPQEYSSALLGELRRRVSPQQAGRKAA